MKQLLARIGECEASRNLLNVDEMNRLLDAPASAPEGFGSLAYRQGLLRGLAAGEFIRIYSSGRKMPGAESSRPAGAPQH
jgi:hypothetical protein